MSSTDPDLIGDTTAPANAPRQDPFLTQDEIAHAFRLYGGQALGDAVAVVASSSTRLRRDITGPARAAAMQTWLTGPLTLQVRCSFDERTRTWNTHQVHLPGGTDSPNASMVRTDAHTWSENVHDEIVMVSLAQPTVLPGCLIVRVAEETETFLPGLVLSGQPMTGIAVAPRDRVLLALLIARSWAINRPNLPARTRRMLIERLCWPNQWAEYEHALTSSRADGPAWKAQDVRSFIDFQVPLERAKPWLDRQVFTTDAASAAWHGRMPIGTPQDWSDAGFSDLDAAEWLSRACSPADAAVFRDHGYTTSLVDHAIGDGLWPLSDLLTVARAGLRAVHLTEPYLVEYSREEMERLADWAKVEPIQPETRSYLADNGVTPQQVLTWKPVGVDPQTLDWREFLAGIHAPLTPQQVLDWGGLPALPAVIDPTGTVRLGLYCAHLVISAMDQKTWAAWNTALDAYVRSPGPFHGDVEHVAGDVLDVVDLDWVEAVRAAVLERRTPSPDVVQDILRDIV